MAPQFVVCMTYDFDALSGRWRPPDYATPAPTSEPPPPTVPLTGLAGLRVRAGVCLQC